METVLLIAKRSVQIFSSRSSEKRKQGNYSSYETHSIEFFSDLKSPDPLISNTTLEIEQVLILKIF